MSICDFQIILFIQLSQCLFVFVALLLCKCVWYDARAHRTRGIPQAFQLEWQRVLMLMNPKHMHMENVSGECIICVKLHETIGANICNSIKSNITYRLYWPVKNRVNCLVWFYVAKVMACIPLYSLIDLNDWHNIDVGPTSTHANQQNAWM